MDATEFKIADKALTTLDDNVNGIVSTIKLCQPRINQALAHTNGQTDLPAFETLFNLLQLLKTIQTLLLQSEAEQAQLHSFVEELRQTKQLKDQGNDRYE
ncbi:hypothetical protein FEZ41_04520 [Lentilactobacillus parafarraginis]|uniref:Uncharacterized protein n=1 Tax=Lentilactobacillus parafarraginis TaxID=390842 RepID=A0A5R9CWU5_9LACO|nr:hypothetical protein [Lentilactobacillus parafarraginis]TLQ20134.1 hypothetical protein FEZ41_04520 [Lentilactobacillus parafarraginis]